MQLHSILIKLKVLANLINISSARIFLLMRRCLVHDAHDKQLLMYSEKKVPLSKWSHLINYIFFAHKPTEIFCCAHGKFIYIMIVVNKFNAPNKVCVRVCERKLKSLNNIFFLFLSYSNVIR